jgi:hypothetical protein
MSLRRVLWASPLAVSVAILAHLVTFGFAHAPGGSHATALLGVLAMSLVFGLARAFAGGLFGTAPRGSAVERSTRFAPLLLAGAGAAAFAFIEFSEGHLALPALLVAALAAVPLAALVRSTSRSADRAARRAGAHCAAFAIATRRLARLAAASYVTGDRLESVATTFVLGTLRGRAPPISF